MNLNELAKEISSLEGGKRNLSIGDIKEVLRCLGDIVKKMSLADALDLLKRLAKARKKK